MTRALYALLPLLGGAMIAVQAPVNARLRTVLTSPIGSAAVSFATGLVILVAAVAIVGDVRKLGSVGNGPWWAYLGGALGAFFVVTTLLAAPRVGVTTTFISVVLGQVAAAAMIDRFGWLGQKPIHFGWERIAALGLLVVALVLLLRGD
ncbi:MAG TPA: DMT family transporter [Miltoncostaea sp.]|nr:DMT family transporter [Miltoncostaea sp.]